jgi:hypothetical protein
MPTTLSTQIVSAEASGRKATPTIDDIYSAEPRLRQIMIRAAQQASFHFGRDSRTNRYYDQKPALERLVGWGRKDRSSALLISAEAYDVMIDQLWRAAGHGIATKIRQQRRRLYN